MPATAHEARRATLSAIGPQTFAAESDRVRLSEVALKAFLALMKAWGLANAEASTLLGVSASTLDRIKRGYRPTLSQDQLTRVSALVGVYKGLHLLFADETADGWARRPNRGPLFDRETPIAAMIEGGIPRMLEVRRYVDAVRGGL
jgi:antitoxin Xre/MbcA/ParS-like protein